MYLPKFEYLGPKTIEEACSLLLKYQKEGVVFAGGTSILPSMKRKAITPRYLIGLSHIPNMDYIDSANGLKIGALTTIRSIEKSSLIQEKFSVLAEAARRMSTVQVRNMGTLGGNLCNFSPGVTMAPPLMVLGAKLKLVGSSGDRVIDIEEFFGGKTSGEILTEIQVPDPPPEAGMAFLKLPRKTAVDRPFVEVAALMALSNGGICSDVRIGLCAVAPTPIRARKAEALLQGKKIQPALIEEAARVASTEIMPRSKPEYRREVTRVLVKRALNQAQEKIVRR
jgi:carbon-monoxide dehydrogenase medium subunit